MGGDLVGGGDMPSCRGLKCHVDVVALGQELVQPECEHGPAVAGLAIRDPACSVSLIALAHSVLVGACLPGELGRRLRERSGPRRRRGFAVGEPGSKPKTSSIQVASGSVVKPSKFSGGVGR